MRFAPARRKKSFLLPTSVSRDPVASLNSIPKQPAGSRAPSKCPILDSMPSRSFRAPLEAALLSSLAFLDGLPDQPVDADATRSELLSRLARPLNEDPLAPEEVVRDLVAGAERGLVRSAGGRFFAWAVGGSVSAALAADWLTSAWDQNAGLYASAPAAAIAEEVSGDWLKELLGLPRSASFAFVSGCQMAHATCLAAARHALLEERGWDVERRGLSGAPPLRILASNRHGSVERAIRLLGIGSANIVDLALDAEERITPSVLEAALVAAPDTATIVVLQAGDLNTGSFDDYRAVIPVARRHHVWVHVDGAFGL
jgi:glutamate/tyrosine decarboxylase-like PLP-dependent enzyme